MQAASALQNALVSTAHPTGHGGPRPQNASLSLGTSPGHRGGWGGIGLGAPAREQRAWSAKPCSRAAWARGQQQAGHEARQPARAWPPPPGSFLLLSAAAAAGDHSPVSVWDPQRAADVSGRTGVDLGRDQRPLALSIQSTVRRAWPLQGPQGLVHSSLQDKQTWCTHAHMRTRHAHAHAHTHPTFRPSVENTSVCKPSEEICTAGIRWAAPSPGGGATGGASPSPPPPP